MNIDEIIKERFSVRSFSKKDIKQEELNEIIKMTRLAPTACNLQPQKIYVIKSDVYKEKIKSMIEAQLRIASDLDKVEL